MRPYKLITLMILALALGVVSGCASSGSTDLIEDVRDVPDGMPVMYEFFTAT